MVCNKSLATIGYMPIFNFVAGNLPVLDFSLRFGLRLGKSSFVGSETWNCLEFLSLWMQDPGRRAVRLFRFLWPWGLPWIPSLVVLVPGNLLRGNLVLGAWTRGCWKPLPGWTSQSVRLSAEEACEDNLYDPQLDQGNEEVIRVALGTYFWFKKVRANRLCWIILFYVVMLILRLETICELSLSSSHGVMRTKSQFNPKFDW